MARTKSDDQEWAFGSRLGAPFLKTDRRRAAARILHELADRIEVGALLSFSDLRWDGGAEITGTMDWELPGQTLTGVVEVEL